MFRSVFMTNSGNSNPLFSAGKKAGFEYKNCRKAVSLSVLRGKMLSDMKRIRITYEKASLGALPPAKEHAPREWLCDNYYLIDREGKATALSLKRRAKVTAAHDGLPVVFHLASSLIEAAGKVGKEEIEIYLSGVQREYLLSNAELFLFRDMLTAAVVSAIAKECNAIASAEGGSAELMSCCVGTLRVMSGADMSECFEKLSASEVYLRRDPAGVYSDMSEETKEYYRECVAEGARREGVGEAEFAKAALEKAERATGGKREKHIGLYIVPEKSAVCGRIFTAVYYSAPLIIAAAAWLLTGNAVFTLMLPVPLWCLWYAVQENVAGAFVKRRFVCSLDPEKIDVTRITIAISCLLTSPEQVKRLAKSLLQVKLSGRGVRCGLVADLKESVTAVRPEDSHILAVAEKEIAKLNDEFGGGFFAVVRKRSYSSGERKYMGRERKRGAINEFVRYINTGVSDYASLTGDLKGVVGSEYLLTLDADTSLSINAAAELTAVLEHPMNKAVVVDNAVKYGYGIAVPKLTTDIESSSRSLFSRIFAGSGGLHSYGGAGGDLYMDLFGDGLFTGKGLIDVKAFNAVIDGAFPDNRVLSHDIIEGGILRACVVSETELSDSFPTTVKAWLIRASRWIRGDFQNAFFLRRNRKNAKGDTVRNEFGCSDRFKLFDNIRRAVSPVFIASAFAVFAFSDYQYKPLVLILLLASASAGEVVATLRGIFKPRIAFRRYITRGFSAFIAGCARIILNVMMLPQLAAIAVYEVVKALWRALVSHKNMLEWLTAAEAESGKRNGMLDYYLYFRFTAIAGIMSMLSGRIPLAVVGALWLLAPAVFCEISRPGVWKTRTLNAEDEEFLYSFAAATWRFFDRYVTEETNYLPPDNVQYSPYRVAMRTSPTNIGLYLLCVLAARDLGFIDSRDMCKRLTSTLETLKAAEKWHGNLYNWYDLKTMEPLKPEYVSTVDSGNLLCCLTALKEGVKDYFWECPELKSVSEACEKLASEADLSKLYDERRKLFYIGYDAAAGVFGNNMYDILMSEARMTSYYAIAKKIADKRHWGMLGRLFAGVDGYVGPLSWTGTMFEYYMPHLLLPVVSDSLTDEALRYALYCQKKRTSASKLPWGVSESGFYSFDMGQNYQYKAFGVQKLGLKRGLDEELVISPYSTFLTLPFAPADSTANLKKLVNMGMNGEFGLYEAVDFTASRTGGGFAIVKSYMAHHMGMTLVSLTNCLLSNVMQKRFMRDTDMRTAQKLLEEAIYDGVSLYKGVSAADVRYKARRLSEEGVVCSECNPSNPRALLLSNGEFSTVITDGGSGFSRWDGIDVSVHRRDLAANPSGVYVLLKEEKKPAFSVTADPLRDCTPHKAEFGSASAVFTAVNDGLEAAMSVSVHGRIPAEIRVIKIGNTEKRKKDTELLIYTEPVMQNGRDHAAHPAFSDLFIMCEYREVERCLLMWRRGEDEEEEACVAYGFADPDTAFEFETDRSAVLNKGMGVFSIGEAFSKEFSSDDGTPVIPCVAIRIRFSLRGGDKKKTVFLQCAGRNREEAVSRFMLVRKQSVQNMMKTSWESAGNMAASISCTASENRLLQTLLPRVFFDTPKTRATAEAARFNTLGKKELWSLSVSGDNPIVACAVSGKDDLERAAAHINVHRIAAVKGARYDLCIIYGEGGAYDGELRSALEDIAFRNGGKGIYLIDAEKAGYEKVRLLKAASVYAEDCGETDAKDGPSHKSDPFTALHGEPLPDGAETESFVPGGAFEIDAFTAYPQKSSSPLPWCFPLANESFGTLVSDSSPGFSFFLNSRLNRLTPWSNDYMADNIGEKLFFKTGERYYDLTHGAFVRFGKGYAEYRVTAGGFCVKTVVSVHGKMPVKIIRVSVENASTELAESAVAYYTEPLPDDNAQCLVKISERGGMLFAENPYNDDYPEMCACLSCSENVHYVTGRETFRSGEWSSKGNITEKPCAAAISDMKIKPGETATVSFFFSMARGKRAAAYPHRFFAAYPDKAFDNADGGEPAYRINTPSEELDRLINFYLPYQAKVSRVLSRTGFSQNSGAYGFRDQLQDVCAMICSDPDLAERHILKAASAQFEEGDVLHWWHKLPKSSGGFKGVRTRCSDDLFWLPYAVSEYVSVTGKSDILLKIVNFIKGDNLLFNETEKYISPVISEKGTVYEHCKRALERGYRIGAHGLILFGSGDWNDGMNEVGVKGKGESVWLSMFACVVMDKFSSVADSMGDAGFASELRERRALLAAALENCWENDRYIRGYHDDGSKLGSEDCAECKIDSLPQSFSVFARLDCKRAETAVNTAIERLTIKDKNIVRLFDPPFSDVNKSIGYIKRYPSGIRENGGQYTHAAVWLARAAFRLGLSDKGAEILSMISPITHSFDARYKTEPYFLAADIYTARPREGRGGWTVYTGAAAWYYRVVIEDLLGLKKRGNQLFIEPSPPSSWPCFEVVAKLDGTVVEIKAERNGKRYLRIDGADCEAVTLDGGKKLVEVGF